MVLNPFLGPNQKEDMCGIAGIINWDGSKVDPQILQKMAAVLAHRGPDEEGFYFSPGAIGERLPAGSHLHMTAQQINGDTMVSVGLAHRRLSIIDLSNGQQPMCNEDGTVWIVFNGEIYNFREVRNTLARTGHLFRTSSDTEVIVHAYEEWGRDCLTRLNGMFAFALWDASDESLFVARDRVGKKPLYYRATDDTFVFGSELKAILVHPGLKIRMDLTAVADYFKYLYVPDPKTILDGVSKLPPAHYLIATKSAVSIAPYWDVNFEKVLAAKESQLADQLFDLLENAVHDRMLSEVPLGAFLSGGVDSSGIVAFMSRESMQPTTTCTIGFDDPEHDESHYAARVAHHLGTFHSEFIIRDDFLGTVSRLPTIFDEPFADSSALPTYHVCKMARQRVTVALSGDGGDETFAGYDKYFKDFVEQFVGRLLPDQALRVMGAVLSGRGPLQRKARTVFSQGLRAPDRAFYETNTFISDMDLSNLLEQGLWKEIQDYDPFEYTGKFFNAIKTGDRLTRMLYTDLKTSLPGDMLVKVDRTSMANSLEVRSPLLDYRIVEFAAALPSHMKMHWGDKKYLLKRVFGRLLPKEIFKRRKHGFTVPLDMWFRGGLTSLAQEVFFSTPEISQFLNVEYIRHIWYEHQTRREDRGTLLWSILIFSLWYQDFRARFGDLL